MDKQIVKVNKDDLLDWLFEKYNFESDEDDLIISARPQGHDVIFEIGKY